MNYRSLQGVCAGNVFTADIYYYIFEQINFFFIEVGSRDEGTVSSAVINKRLDTIKSTHIINTGLMI